VNTSPGLTWGFTTPGHFLDHGLDLHGGCRETPEDIIERVRTCLDYRDPERLEISTDCGLRRVPRYLAISKMSAAAEAARRLRKTG
jgi:5-methyltetrahydropteroyltriglutamate--homocysteine methyltransferase